MLLFKNTVRFSPTLSPIWVLIQVANEVYEEFGYDCVVTSFWDGMHSRTSLHWVGHAVDLRTSGAGIPPHEARMIADEIKRRLPWDEFDVVVESDHIHGEWQPKR